MDAVDRAARKPSALQTVHPVHGLDTAGGRLALTVWDDRRQTPMLEQSAAREPVSKPGGGGTLKPATLVTIGFLATASWMGSVSDADACSCGFPETLVARDASAAVFEGTVVDRRITLVSDGAFWFPAPEQDIVVRRVWKGVSTNRVSVLYLNGGMCSGAVPVGMTALFFMRQERGRLKYGLCLPNQPITDAAQALAALGPPIATFADRPAAALTVPAALPRSRRLRAVVATAGAYYLNGSIDRFRFHPPLQWGHRLLLCVLLLQFVSAIILASRRLLRRSLLLCATSAIACCRSDQVRDLFAYGLLRVILLFVLLGTVHEILLQTSIVVDSGKRKLSGRRVCRPGAQLCELGRLSEPIQLRREELVSAFDSCAGACSLTYRNPACETMKVWTEHSKSISDDIADPRWPPSPRFSVRSTSLRRLIGTSRADR